MANTNSRFHSASREKNDEFHTRLEDIENEVRYYREHFRGKTVLCNCDDPRVSNFFRYFTLNFEALGLKKVIATCYKNCEPDLFTENNCEHSIYITYEGDKNGNRVPDPSEMEVMNLKGDGDFRSQECIELLKQADIICTNPPFSLIREYIAQLMQYKKQFLIIGNTNIVVDKDIFPFIKDDKLWVGVTNYNVGMFFVIPDSYQKYHHIDEKTGQKIGRVSTSCWWTNIENKRRNDELIMVEHYTPEAYPHYDNYDAIECGNYKKIPMDYDGVIGVPVTFMGHYCPKQFEILGVTTSSKENAGEFFCGKGSTKTSINGVEQYARLLIRRRQ